MATKAGGAYIEVRADNKHLAGDLYASKSMVQKSAANMQASMVKAFKQIGIASLVAGAAVGAVSLKILALGREFETTMKTVQAWSGATGDDLKALTGIARKMGATTEWTANQAASALKYLAAAGFTAKQSIAALPGTLDLATAGQVDLARATDITTDVLTAFGMEVEELGRVSDAFITTASSSNTNVMMLGESFKMVAPTAHLFKLSIEETAAMLGTLANSGIKAEMAGSGLNMVLMKSGRAAKMLGLDAMTPLVDVLKKMKEEEWSAVKIGEAFGVRQVKTATILMNNIEMFEKLTKKIVENKGATKDLAAVIRDSLDNDLKVLNSTIQEEMLKVFDRYKEDLRDVVQLTTDWIQKNGELIGQKTFKAIEDIASAVGKIVAIYEVLPSGVIGAAGTGLVGTILFGPVAGGFIAVLTYTTGKLITLYGILEDIAILQGTFEGAPMSGGIGELAGDYLSGKGVRGKITSRDVYRKEQAAEAVKQAEAAARRLLPSPTETPPSVTARETPYAGFVPFQAMPGGASEQFEVMKTLSDEYDRIEEDRLRSVAEFNAQYAELGKSQFELEREQVLAQSELWAQAGVDKVQNARVTAQKIAEIDKAEKEQRISNLQSFAGSMADNFKNIAEMGGKENKKAFAMWKAFKIAETIMATYSAAIKAYESMVWIPVVGPALGTAAAGMAVAFGLSQVQMIRNAQPPSYEVGTDYVPETGLAMLHEGEAVLTKKENKRRGSGGGNNYFIMENPVFQDKETMALYMQQIAKVTVWKEAPAAIYQDYSDDGRTRQMVRGRA